MLIKGSCTGIHVSTGVLSFSESLSWFWKSQGPSRWYADILGQYVQSKTPDCLHVMSLGLQGWYFETLGLSLMFLKPESVNWRSHETMVLLVAACFLCCAIVMLTEWGTRKECVPGFEARYVSAVGRAERWVWFSSSPSVGHRAWGSVWVNGKTQNSRR